MRAVNWLPLRCVRRCWHARQSLSRDALRVTAALLYLSLRCFSLRSRVACHRLHRCRVVRFAIHSHAASSPPPLPREGTPLCSCVSHRRLRRCRVGASRCALTWRIAAAAAAWEHLAALSRGVSPPPTLPRRGIPPCSCRSHRRFRRCRVRGISAHSGVSHRRIAATAGGVLVYPCVSPRHVLACVGSARTENCHISCDATPRRCGLVR